MGYKNSRYERDREYRETKYHVDLSGVWRRGETAGLTITTPTVGVGVVEAPRGTLIHDYETEENGLVTNVNLIVGTTHNNAPINMSVKQAATSLIKEGKYDQGLLNQVEMSIRAYDPCLSCATHKLDGSLAVKVTILDSKGDELATLVN